VPNVVVVGSMVADIVVWLPRFPDPHETLLATASETHPGGKGLCQAVAAARAGADVTLVGRVGDDAFGTELLDLLGREGINTSCVATDPAGTSLGIPMISPDGANRIIGIPRASARLTPRDVARAAAALADAHALVLQLEVPLDTCWAAIRAVDPERCTVVWNPAPATVGLEDLLPDDLLGRVHWITPNEIEAGHLAAMEVTDAESALAAAGRLQARRPGLGIVVTLGSLGAVALAPDGSHLHLEGNAVSCVDSTGAGDAFTGAFVTALARGDDLAAALSFANAAGALATTTVGAATGLPVAAAIEELAAGSGGAQ
jgi:ribokinase